MSIQMTNPNKSSANMRGSELLQIIPMIKAYREAEQAAFIAHEQLDKSMVQDVDHLTYAQQQLEASRAENAVLENLHAICSYRARAFEEVLIKLSIWRDTAIGHNVGIQNLSPVERLVLSAHNDLNEILERSGFKKSEAEQN